MPIGTSKAFHDSRAKRKSSKSGARSEAELEEFRRHLRISNDSIEPVYQRVLSGSSLAAVYELIEYLSADVPAFGSGYAKERFYRRLKRLPLIEGQVSRLCEIAFERCASGEYRRDDSELRRLMIRLADWDFLNRVAAIPAQAGSRIDGHKRRMLQVVLGGRKDLRAKAP